MLSAKPSKTNNESDEAKEVQQPESDQKELP